MFGGVYFGQSYPAGVPQVAAAPVTYTDTASGAVAFGGSLVEAATYTDAGSGAEAFAGSNVETRTYGDSQTGSRPLSGTLTDARSGADAPSGAGTQSGTTTDAATYADAASGAVTFGGGETDDYEPPASPTGAIVFTGTADEVATYGDSPSGGLGDGSGGGTVIVQQTITGGGRGHVLSDTLSGYSYPPPLEPVLTRHVSAPIGRVRFHGLLVESNGYDPSEDEEILALLSAL